jgi:nicotinamide/nicotinate riboside kinase
MFMKLMENRIPFTDGLQDWDCPGSLDVPFLLRSLDHIRAHGTLPPEVVSKEDRNVSSDSGVSSSTIDALRAEVKEWLEHGDGKSLGLSNERPIAILEGILLYAESVKEVREKLDVKLFLRADFETAKHRREARKGYVTIEGFWEDPEGYVEKIVWPNYVKEHRFLFQGGDVEAAVDSAITKRLGIDVQRGDLGAGVVKEECDGMNGVLKWAVEVLMERLVKLKIQKVD